jgi:hypothetical protein
LCAAAVASKDPAELARGLPQLKSALHAHNEQLRTMAERLLRGRAV